ncbi:MAG: lipopolysaccharide core heptose(I) kinase RfaP [Pseudomonadales bacterium]|nr:lipopolysaccharide core heptose(I) kinase RfaP [Pseudomonadales bacterium]
MAWVDSEIRDYLQPDHLFEQVTRLEGEVFREVETRKTLRFSLGDQNYFVKIHRGVGWKEILKNLLQFRWPVLGARNEWLALRKLRQAGIDTLEPLAYTSEGLNPAGLKSCLVTRALEDTLSLEEVCQQHRLRPGLKHRLITRTAEITARLHQLGVNHRDLYICHFLIRLDELDAENPRLFLIDLHRAQIRNHTPQRWQVKDVGALYFSAMVDAGLTRNDIYRFLRAYTGLPLREALQADRHFWRQVQQRGEALYLESWPQLPDLMKRQTEALDE